MRVLAITLVALAAGPLRAQPQRHVVIVDLDGVRRDLLDSAYLAGKLPHFQRLFGSPLSPGYRMALYFEQGTSVAPTVTMSGQASLFTGAYPGVHGIAGNNWFDRRNAVAIDYMSTTGVACVYGFALFGTSGCEGGRANDDLTAPTLYERATAAGLTSVVAYNQYWKGSTQVIGPTISDALALLQSGETDLEFIDQDMIGQAIAEIQHGGRPSILTLYFAGADAAGHAHGTGAVMDYLSQVIDPLLGSFLEALDQIGQAWYSNTLFIFSADHGRTDTSAIPDDLLAVGWMASTLAGAGYDSEHAYIANEGGLAHVYLRPAGATWNESPAAAELMAAAASVAADTNLGNEIESVCFRDGGYVCLNPVDAYRARLLDVMNSARTGDLVLLAKPGRYFGNTSPDGAEHGALDGTDLAVPVILAGGGILPGRISEPVSTVQIAATIAAYLGFAADGAQPALPGVAVGKLHRVPPRR
ncbi:MAG TPA: alkaline phosphatase family protein [Bryobacteraceae bacterium]|nr:alkaline phosphatase family protein [Bryobacteraceae bacterium]